MSRFTLASLPRMEVSALSEQLLALKTLDNPIAVIDVRDRDHVGGHIRGSRWVPSHQFEERLPTLLRQLQHNQTVVFHCALSKQRGPIAALSYIREREAAYGIESVAPPEGSGRSGYTKKQDTSAQESNEEEKPPVAQEVYVLRGGFSRWQKSYGQDERLTEAYVKDLWEEY